MVAYSVKAHFAQPIIDETKGGTIRNDRKRHARPGEEIQIYTGMRTKHCRLVARKICLDVAPIRLVLTPGNPSVAVAGLTFSAARKLDYFAIFDGFADWPALREFWREVHEALTSFSGVHIRWLPWPRELLT